MPIKFDDFQTDLTGAHPANETPDFNDGEDYPHTAENILPTLIPELISHPMPDDKFDLKGMVVLKRLGNGGWNIMQPSGIPGDAMTIPTDLGAYTNLEETIVHLYHLLKSAEHQRKENNTFGKNTPPSPDWGEMLKANPIVGPIPGGEYIPLAEQTPGVQINLPKAGQVSAKPHAAKPLSAKSPSAKIHLTKGTQNGSEDTVD